MTAWSEYGIPVAVSDSADMMIACGFLHRCMLKRLRSCCCDSQLDVVVSHAEKCIAVRKCFSNVQFSSSLTMQVELFQFYVLSYCKGCRMVLCMPIWGLWWCFMHNLQFSTCQHILHQLFTCSLAVGIDSCCFNCIFDHPVRAAEWFTVCCLPIWELWCCFMHNLHFSTCCCDFQRAVYQ